MESRANEVTHVVQGMRMGGIEKGGKLYFDADDVTRHLGYLHPQEAIERHCRNVDTSIIPGVQMIPESDFYRLIFRSRKPEAKAFVRWVCHDVLPSIRKHGFYGTKSLTKQIQNATPDEICDLAKRLLAERGAQRGDKAADDFCWPPHLRSDAHKGSVIKTRADLKKWLAENATTTAANNNSLSDVSSNGQNAVAGRETANGGLFDRGGDGMISDYGPLSHVETDAIFDELLYRYGNTQALFIAVKADGTATLRNMHNGDGVPPVKVLRKLADELEAQESKGSGRNDD